MTCKTMIGSWWHIQLYLFDVSKNNSSSPLNDWIVCVCVLLGLELRAFTLSHSTSPLCDGYFRDRVSRTICPGWLQTAILLISASWIARITGMSHWCPPEFFHTLNTLSRLCAVWVTSLVVPAHIGSVIEFSK
jgi:hypothetical protein